MIRLLSVLMLTLWSSTSQAACRQALALGLDVSGSVDSTEYQIQTNGLANALLHPEVRQALLAIPDTPVRLAVFEWSGPGLQRLLVGWTEIDNDASLRTVAGLVRGADRATGDPSTAIGIAARYGLGLLSAQKDCWKRTLDLSGDGESNNGPHPREMRPLAEAGDITINGLVIGDGGQSNGGDLTEYYMAYVASGPGAFVEVAAGFQDFEAAMIRKLKRELQGQLFSMRNPRPFGQNR